MALNDMWDCLRDPQAVQQEREAANQRTLMTSMVAQTMTVGQSMLQAVETGEYMGRQERILESERTHQATIASSQRSQDMLMREAESLRRLARMERKLGVISSGHQLESMDTDYEYE